MYTAEELAAYLSFDPVPVSWKHCLKAALEQYREDWPTRLNFEEIITFYDLEDSFSNRLSQELPLLQKDRKLNFACWLWHFILFHAGPEQCGDIWTWDSREDAFSRHGSPMMAAVTLLSGYPRHRQNMERYHFDKEQVKTQQNGIRYYCTWDGKKHGTDGIRFRQMIFASGLVTGLMTWHGRLQYELIPEGFAPLSPFLTGNPPVVFVHIPEDGPLDETAVSQSLKTALEKIPEYYRFPVGRQPVFFTQSWLLSPQLLEILPESSRILKFQKHFRIVDTQSCPGDFLYFIFGRTRAPEHLEDLPEQSSLQREIKKRFLAGAPLERGLGILQVV